MRVFSYWDSTGKRPTIDIFIASPIAFEELAGRPQDLADIERLRDIERQRNT